MPERGEVISVFRLAMAVLLAVSLAIGKSVESQGAFWEGSSLFVTLVLFLLGFRIAVRWNSGKWLNENEWLYFPFYVLLLAALWLWVRVWDTGFVVVGGFAIYLWLDYLRERLKANDYGE